MRLPRFTIAGLMGLVVVVAVGVAALRYASELWAGILLLLTLGVLGASVLAFHEREGARRAWWRGFALFGWGYVALTMGPWATGAIAPRLPTTMGLDVLYARMHPGTARMLDVRIWDLGSRDTKAAGALTTYARSAVRFSPDDGSILFPSSVNTTPEPFRRVGHCLWALLVAGVGGVAGRACHASGERVSA
jgi:hypothetical protein